MSNLDELVTLIEQWGVNKGILGPQGKGTVSAQVKKMLEEAKELYDEVQGQNIHEAMTREGYDHYTRDCNLETGDVFVTLVLLCAMRRQSLAECVSAAYEKISKRTGKMVDGQFVKD